MARTSVPRASYPTIPRLMPTAPDPGSQAVARAANAVALGALAAAAPQTPEGTLATGVTSSLGDSLGRAVGQLVERAVGAPAPASAAQTPIEDHLRLTRDGREALEGIIKQLEGRIEDLTGQVDDLKTERDGAYQAGFKEADEKAKLREEVLTGVRAETEGLRTEFQKLQMGAKDGQIQGLTTELGKAIEALRQAQTDLREATAQRVRLETEIVKRDHATEVTELRHKLERAEERVPQAETPQQKLDNAWADAKGTEIRETAQIAVQRARQAAADEHRIAEAQAGAWGEIGGVLHSVSEQAPRFLSSMAAGNAPSRYGPPRAVRPPGPQARPGGAAPSA